MNNYFGFICFYPRLFWNNLYITNLKNIQVDLSLHPQKKNMTPMARAAWNVHPEQEPTPFLELEFHRSEKKRWIQNTRKFSYFIIIDSVKLSHGFTAAQNKPDEM